MSREFLWIQFLLVFVCATTQKDCGEGCSKGLPGVPGMAGAKGEKGDEGKPGVTQLDSCDRVRLGERDSFLAETFSASLHNSPTPESYQHHLTCGHWAWCCALINAEWQALIVHWIHVCMAGCVFLSVWHNIVPAVKPRCDNFLCCLFPVFRETAERTGDTSSGQLRLPSPPMHLHIHLKRHVNISSCLIYLPCRVTDPALDHLVFQERLDHLEGKESLWVCHSVFKV